MGPAHDAQAHKEGITAQQLARFTTTGLLERQRHGVYRVAGAPPEPDDDIRVAWLALNPDEIASERLAERESRSSPNLSAALAPPARRRRRRPPRIHHQPPQANPRPPDTPAPTHPQPRPMDPGTRPARHHRDPPRSMTSPAPGSTEATSPGSSATRSPTTTPESLKWQRLSTRTPTTTAHRLGQGAILLQRFLEQAGVPESTHAAGALAGPYTRRSPSKRVLNQAIPSTFGINARRTCPAPPSRAKASRISKRPPGRAPRPPGDQVDPRPTRPLRITGQPGTADQRATAGASDPGRARRLSDENSPGQPSDHRRPQPPTGHHRVAARPAGPRHDDDLQSRQRVTRARRRPADRDETDDA